MNREQVRVSANSRLADVRSPDQSAESSLMEELEDRCSGPFSRSGALHAITYQTVVHRSRGCLTIPQKSSSVAVIAAFPHKQHVERDDTSRRLEAIPSLVLRGPIG